MYVTTCEAVVVHCIDFRVQDYLNNWLTKRFGPKNYDRISIAGAVKDFDYAWGQIEIALRLHQPKKAILINHEDCGAYGAEGTLMRHKADLDEAHRKILEKVPTLIVERYYLHLDGTFEKLD